MMILSMEHVLKSMEILCSNDELILGREHVLKSIEMFDSDYKGRMRWIL